MTEKIKKYKFMIATDRDGTIDTIDKNSKDPENVEYIIDSSINAVLSIAKAHDCMSVLISGRTPDDNLQDLKTHSIGTFDYIVGDNGGTIYNTKTKEIIKFSLGETVVDNIFNIINKTNTTYNNFPINKDKNNIMPIDNIRFTNGENIFAYNNPNNHEYYKKKSVQYFNSIDELKAVKDITKITLAGPKTLMKIFSAEINNLGLKTHLVKSKFPNKSSNNYILDITSPQSTKGNAIKFLAKKHQVEKYYSFGNDWNDESLVLETILSGNTAYVVSRNAPEDFLTFLHKKVKDLKQSGTKNLGKIVFIPDSNSLNAMKKTISNEMLSHSSGRNYNFKDSYRVHSFYSNKSLPNNKPKKFVPKIPNNEKNKGDR